MQENYSSLANKAFGDDANSLITVKYRSHIDALKAVESSLRDAGGVSLLFGSDGSGKTTILREFALHLANETDVVYIDGSHLKPHQLLAKMLTQLGGDVHAGSDEQMLREVSDVVSEQTRSWQPPVMIIDNVDRMYPSSLRVLNTLAGVEVDTRFALRFLLSGHSALKNLIDSDGMTNMAQRYPASYTLGPLSAKETMIYLHARLQAAGSERADTVFPFDVCDRLREQSAGWPGQLNKFAREAIKRSSGFPLSVVDTYGASEKTREASGTNLPVLEQKESTSRLPPRLVVSKNGAVISEYTFKEKKVLLGRSDFVDVIIDDDFVSKVHAVFLLYSDALVMLDLNSANGTTVNSETVKKTILKSDDIISLGNHRLKVENAPLVSEEMEELLKSPDTLKMKNLVDLRRQRARRRTKVVGRN
jgi:type II secretory pathway predicted ATPase ExeA